MWIKTVRIDVANLDNIRNELQQWRWVVLLRKRLNMSWCGLHKRKWVSKYWKTCLCYPFNLRACNAYVDLADYAKIHIVYINICLFRWLILKVPNHRICQLINLLGYWIQFLWLWSLSNIIMYIGYICFHYILILSLSSLL